MQPVLRLQFRFISLHHFISDIIFPNRVVTMNNDSTIPLADSDFGTTFAFVSILLLNAVANSAQEWARRAFSFTTIVLFHIVARLREQLFAPTKDFDWYAFLADYSHYRQIHFSHSFLA